MPTGPGKYDHLCTQVRLATGARAAVVIVLDGNRGDGFSVQADETVHASVLRKLPDILEAMAKQIRADTAPSPKK